MSKDIFNLSVKEFTNSKSNNYYLNMSVREFLGHDRPYLSFNCGIDNETLSETLAVMEKYNLRLQMRDIDFRLYEEYSQSVLFKVGLDKLLSFNPKLYHALKRCNICSIPQLVTRTEDEIINVRKIGPKYFEQLKVVLKELNLTFGMSEDDLMKYVKIEKKIDKLNNEITELKSQRFELINIDKIRTKKMPFSIT